VASWLPGGAAVGEVASADLTGDGRDEVLVAWMSQAGAARQPIASVFTLDARGQHAQVFQRRIIGENWAPIQVGRPADGAPVAAVFSAWAGSEGTLAYVVVQQLAQQVQVTLENSGLFSGGIRFVSEGLLESRGDVDRLYRWSDSGWQAEDLGSQYVPALPPETTTVSYTIDAVRGPKIDVSREIRVRVGQHLFLHRDDRGEPSRIGFSGTPSAYSVGADGVITFLQPDVIEIYIEGPARSGRTLTLSVTVEPR
jgi:hypothetical protein